MSRFKYKAFISYSHEDEATARWLHSALETYRPPRGVLPSSQVDAHSTAFPLRPIFRDQEELVAAANLSRSLVEALQQSEFLIVICSPNSARSHWTNREIIEFKKIHGSDNIIAVVAEGDPERSFPTPLRQEVLPTGEIGAAVLEPLAADLQGGRANRRLALHKVAATLLGVGLDQLVQREAQRRHRFLALVATAAMVGMVVMGWLTYTAVNERRAADAARAVADESRRLAEQRREEAEGLIEFMLSDLREKLEPVGRLDVLDVVGSRALDYYARQDQQSLEPESLGRRARALHLLGEISGLKGDVEAALDRFTLAAESTELLMVAQPDNPRRVFDHAQSVFWMGLVAFQQGHYAQASVSFERYLQYAQQLVELEPAEPRWLLELFYGHQAMGGLAVEIQDWSQAETHLLSAVDALERLREKGDPRTDEWANIHSWLSSAYRHQKKFRQAGVHSREEVNTWMQVLEQDPADQAARRQLVIARRGAAQLALIGGDSDAALDLLLPEYTALREMKTFEPDHTLTLEQDILLLQDLVEIRVLQGELAAAAEQSRACVNLAEALRQRDDSVLFWQVELDWRCRYLAAQVAFEQQRTDQAEQWLDTYYGQLVSDYDSIAGQKEAPLLLAESSLLLGDIVYTQGREDEARRLWHRAQAALEGEPDELEPTRIAALVTVLHRLGKQERADALAAYLRDRGYRHPGFESGADGSLSAQGQRRPNNRR
ncbi:TIR domain-containing protein [Seongchinamella unica]|uniref:TIR domain-containing protein n=1 Tax=Seongchinamella unica TaxID=2547392 RepID=A0A4V2ZXA2_9GAMM|nr:toll/interleukin-1 receptor domain-containing protein [Seongchinamella unica]TDG12783.1 TIR domain-containing protein [Seongchinamella unica]